jgi:glycine/D-amino acid oxidase-like deaminating enzyme
MQDGLQVMRDAGLSFKTLTAEETRIIEPALNPDASLAQAIHFPDDEVSNCLNRLAQAETREIPPSLFDPLLEK